MAKRMPKRLSPIFTWRSAIAVSTLKPTTRLVAFGLGLHFNERGGSAYPSQKTLARETGLSDRAVGIHLRTLIDEGWIVPVAGGKRQGKTTTFEAAIPPEIQSGEGRNDVPTLGEHEVPTGSESPSDEVVREVGRVSQETLPAKTPRKRDPLWDVFTEELYPAVTANERGRRNAALKQIRDAMAAVSWHIPVEAQAGELRARIARYRVRFPGVACTETAIASHWSSLAGPNGRPAQPPCPECEMGGGQHAADCSQVSVGSVT